MEASDAKTLYEFKGSDPNTINPENYLFANLRVPGENSPLYTFVNDASPGDQHGSSEEWGVYTGPTEVFPPVEETPAAEAASPAADPAAEAPAESGADAATKEEGESPTPEVFPPVEETPAAEPVGFKQVGDPIEGNSGLDGQPTSLQADVNTPVASSAPDPSTQSGVPLAEDRAAGVQPNAEMAQTVAPDAPDVAKG